MKLVRRLLFASRRRGRAQEAVARDACEAFAFCFAPPRYSSGAVTLSAASPKWPEALAPA
eukprot:COSAG06_NODE_43_length_29826_cov_32.009621_10_plen_60_part_00